MMVLQPKMIQSLFASHFYEDALENKDISDELVNQFIYETNYN